jgi:hypothetical protein
MEKPVHVIFRRNQSTQTNSLATLHIEPGTQHNILLQKNKDQVVDLIKGSNKIYKNILLGIEKPSPQTAGSYIDLRTRTSVDIEIKTHLEFNPSAHELYQSGIDHQGNYYTNV